MDLYLFFICALRQFVANAVQNYHKCLGAANILTIFIQVYHFAIFIQEGKSMMQVCFTWQETYPMFRFLQKIGRIY